MAPDDVEYEVDQLKSTVEELFPKVFRGGVHHLSMVGI